MLLYSFIAAIGFLLILEGIGPFAAPKLWKRTIASLTQLSDKFLHIAGFVAMMTGLVIIILAHLFL